MHQPMESEPLDWSGVDFVEPRIGCNIYGDISQWPGRVDMDGGRGVTRSGSMPDLIGCPNVSRKRLRQICAINAALSRGMHCYLITTTHPLDWGMMQRRKALTDLLDVVRKDAEVAGYVWATERHRGGPSHGRIHHHLFIRCWTRWEYRRVVKKWSVRYCGSVNGLDVKARGAEGALYSGKMARYVGKEGTGLLPFRHWGSSAIIKQAEFGLWDYPTFVEQRGDYVRMLTVGRETGLGLAVDAQRIYELERRLRKLKARLKKREAGRRKVAV